MEERLCLQWNDFQDNIQRAFWDMREDKYLTDVTLACKDGQQVEAHKVVLASSSPFFQKLFARNRQAHPLIYMGGVKLSDVLAILDFLYRGEANVYQGDLDSFLAISDELQLKGLMGKINENVVENTNDQKYQAPYKVKEEPKEKNSNKTICPTEQVCREVVPKDFSSDLDELEAKVLSMIEISETRLPSHNNRRAHACKVCGKEGFINNIKDHIEANHLEGISLPCKHCDNFFRTRNGLRRHKAKFHFNSLEVKE